MPGEMPGGLHEGGGGGGKEDIVVSFDLNDTFIR